MDVMNKSVNNHRYTSIDIMKLILSFLVVAIHTQPFTEYSDEANFFYVQILARIAVPFFFITSGFFLGLKRQKKLGGWALFRYYFTRVGRLFILWTLIYLPINLRTSYMETDSLQSAIFLLIHRTLFLAPSFLWYLIALLVGSIPICFIKKSNVKSLLLVSIVLYVIGCFGNSYYELIPSSSIFIKNIYDVYLSIFLTTRNGVFFAMPFMAIGFYMSGVYKNFCNWKLIVLLLVLFGLFSFEVISVYNFTKPLTDYSMYFTLIPLVTVLLLFLTNINVNISERTQISFRQLSVGIYCSQAGMIFILRNMLIRLFDFDVIKIPTLLYIFVLVFSILFVYIIIAINNKTLLKLIS